LTKRRLPNRRLPRSKGFFQISARSTRFISPSAGFRSSPRSVPSPRPLTRWFTQHKRPWPTSGETTRRPRNSVNRRRLTWPVRCSAYWTVTLAGQRLRLSWRDAASYRAPQPKRSRQAKRFRTLRPGPRRWEMPSTARLPTAVQIPRRTQPPIMQKEKNLRLRRLRATLLLEIKTLAHSCPIIRTVRNQ
jgi:hypothetical protein